MAGPAHDGPPARHTRRGLLALCGAAVAGVAGCTAPFRDAPSVVAGVESKVVRATRENRSRKLVATNSGDPVEHDAPVDADLRTVAYDDEYVSFPETGSLVVDDDAAARIDRFYDDVTYAVVVTVYEEEPVVGVPLGNAMGYHAPREAFNRVDPGDRVVFRADPRADVATVDEVVAVTTAAD